MSPYETVKEIKKKIDKKEYVVNFTMDVDFPIDRCDTEEEVIKKAKWYLENDPDKYEQYIDIDVWEVNKMSEEKEYISARTEEVIEKLKQIMHTFDYVFNPYYWMNKERYVFHMRTAYLDFIEDSGHTSKYSDVDWERVVDEVPDMLESMERLVNEGKKIKSMIDLRERARVGGVNKMSEDNKRIEKDLRIDPESMSIETRVCDAEKDRICSRRQRV